VAPASLLGAVVRPFDPVLDGALAPAVASVATPAQLRVQRLHHFGVDTARWEVAERGTHVFVQPLDVVLPRRRLQLGDLQPSVEQLVQGGVVFGWRRSSTRARSRVRARSASAGVCTISSRYRRRRDSGSTPA